MSSICDVRGYQTEGKLGRGGYGQIFAVRENGTHELYALKTEMIDSKNRSIANEIDILQALPRETCFPFVKTQGETQAVRYFVMPLFGPSISRMLKEMENQKFTLGTALKVGYEMIQIIERCHRAGVVHCDIKPGNFLMNQISIGGFVLVDFGLSSFWKDPETGRHIENRKGDGFRGTMKYASVNVHKNIEPTRRDDVISWFYSVIELAKGKLPWKDVQDNGLAMSCKQTITPEKLCAGLPNKMKDIWNSIKDLEFEAAPNYSAIKSILLDVMRENECEHAAYDWEYQPLFIQRVALFPELFSKELAAEEKRRLRDKKKSKKCSVQ